MRRPDARKTASFPRAASDEIGKQAPAMAKEDAPKSENQEKGMPGAPGSQSGNSSVSGSDQA